MKRKALIPLDEEIRNAEIERINRETRRLEEEAAHAERVREATAARDAAQERLQRVVGGHNPQSSSSTPANWRISTIVGPPDEIISEAFEEPKQEEPKVELQKVDTAKFVFLWENSTSVMDVAIGMQHPSYQGGVSVDDIALAKELAKVIRTVEQLPLRKLPDHPPKCTPGKINNLTLPKE